MAADLIEVREAHRFDEAALARWLRPHLPDAEAPMVVHQFQGGQSNPTYHLQIGAHAYVLRKKPPGKLLPSAHAVDREYRVMKALADTQVPVPRMQVLCEDDSVIGTAFYVMDHVEGRVFHDRTMPGCTATHRRAAYESMVETMAHLHNVDWQAVGLEGFGKPEGYAARQIKRWSTQYRASQFEECVAMDKLIDWLALHPPVQDRSTIVHGDFRLGNLLLDLEAPKVIAVLDWELATLGDPLSDLAYNVSAYLMPPGIGQGLTGVPAADGYPGLEQSLVDYARLTDRDAVPDLRAHLVFSLFRSAAIGAGVYKRGLDGNAADASALEAGAKYRVYAERGLALAETGH